MNASKESICLIVMGMAGCGKTTFVSRLAEDMKSNEQTCLLVNLDPAVLSLPYTPHIDIRSEVSYSGVKQQYGLGPNGAILTCFNIFATKFNQVMETLEKKSKGYRYIIIDTPGQIEVFTSSASGNIITHMLASTYPTTITYLLDTPRNTQPTTFISNMLHACSIDHKSLLPFLLVFNKTDLKSSEQMHEWMADFEAFADALETSSASYINNLSRSLSLALDQYYSVLKTCSVSSLTGEGMQAFVDLLPHCKTLYFSKYKQAQEEMLASELQRQLHVSAHLPSSSPSSSQPTSAPT